MPSKPKRLGKGAVGKCLARLVHPSELIRKIFPHMNNKKELTGLTALRLEKKLIYKVKTICVIFHSTEVKDNDDEYIELYCSKRFFRILCEGNPDDFFTEEDYDPEDEIDVDDHNNILIPDEVYEMMERKIIDENVITVVKCVMIVDDNDKPLPENIPTTADDDSIEECEYSSEWGFNGICPRRMNNIIDVKPVIKVPVSSTSTSTPDLDELFDIFFPKSYIVDVMLPMMNIKIMKTKGDDNNELLLYGEFLRFIGLWLLMATTHVTSRHDFWDTNNVSMFTGAPFRLNDLMSYQRFEIILSSLCYTDKDQPSYVDRFFPIRQLVDAYNNNMKNNFSPGWITCVDESMMEWTNNNKFMCPGLMCVPRKKPYPFGNEWHTICCGLSGIMFHVEMEESNDIPEERIEEENTEYDIHGKTVGLLLRLTKSIWYTGKVLILNSNYSVLKALIEVRKKGLFASAQIEKRSSIWPKYINGDAIIEHFNHNNMDDGDIDAICGTMDKQTFHIFGMKLPDSIVMMMSTYGTNERIGCSRPIKQRVGNNLITFQCPEVIANHRTYQDIVIQHDHRRQTPLSLDVVWKLKNWSTRVFAFLLSITEINIMYASTYFYGEKKTTRAFEFRKKLSDKLIHNKYLPKVQVEEEVETAATNNNNITAISNQHKLISLPRHQKFHGEKLVPSNMAYPQFLCTGCKRRIRTYCQCSKGIYRCAECYTTHFIEEMKTEMTTTKEEEKIIK